MAENETLDDLLEVWDDLIAEDPQADLDAFIREHGDKLDDDSTAKFRKKATALAAMNKRLDAFQDTASVPSDTSRLAQSHRVLADLKPGYEPIEGYKLVERLGKGGFGEVWKATDARGFSVAIKFVSLGGPLGEKESASLDVIKDVRHPHLLTIVGTRQIDNVLVIAMELADRTLLARFEEAQKEGCHGIPRDELLGYMAEAAEGIDFLNDPGTSGRHRIQHRDIKPQNLLLSGNSVKIADYGLAQALTFNVAESTGSTPMYAAPEFFDGNTTSRSDQYSLAITYCFLCGGRAPFEGDVVELMEAHQNREPDLTMLLSDECPAVARALSKKSKDRWPTCAAFVEALRSAVAEPCTTPVEAPGLGSKLRELPIRTKVIAGVAGAFLVLLILMFGLFGGNGANDAQRDSTTPLTLAVLDFTNHSQDPELDGFRLGFRDMLTTDLSGVLAIRILDRARLEALLKEHGLAETRFIDQQTAVQLGRGLSAHQMLAGSYVISGEDIRVDVRLVSVETSEVLFADSVTGKKSDLLGLERLLAEKVISGLEVKPTDAEVEALQRSQVADYEAFRLYSEARLAQIGGEREKAEQRLRAALEQDAGFPLATFELAKLEDEALFRLDEERKRKAKAAGEVGAQLQEHWQGLQRIVEADRRDAECFAALIAMSGHAGLWGDQDDELRLLATYWERFVASVPVGEAAETGKAINAILAHDGESLQKLVDSGDYTVTLEGFDDAGNTGASKYLKPELRTSFRWPEYSAMWPFDQDLRAAFQIASSKAAAKAIGPDWFDRQLPAFPHDYLKNVWEEHRGTRPGNAREETALRLRMLAARYYMPLMDRPPALSDNLHRLHKQLLVQLEGTDPLVLSPSALRQAITALEAVAKTESDSALREPANSVMLRFIRQARINEGRAPSAAASRSVVEFCGLKLAGPRFVFCLDMGDIGEVVFPMFVRKQLADTIRTLRPTDQFDVRLFGEVAAARSALFGTPQSADAKHLQEALILVKSPTDRFDPTVDETELLQALEQTIAGWPNGGDSAGDVCVICFETPRMSEADLDSFLKRLPKGLRLNVVTTEKSPALARLVKDSGGSAAVLEEGDFLNVKVIRWDVEQP